MPDARAREIARKLAAWFVSEPCAHDLPRTMDCMPCVADALAAALTRERDEENAACAQLACPYCRGGLPTHRATPAQRDSGRWIHRHVDDERAEFWLPCHASAIRQRRTPGAAEGERTDG